MTEQEAIKVLEKEKAYMDSHGGDMQSKALEMAIKALEKQIAKDVYEAHFYREPFPIYRCPVCPNTSIERNQVYCQDCGQKLDWSEV
jgi:hypothetical protein